MWSLLRSQPGLCYTCSGKTGPGYPSILSVMRLFLWKLWKVNTVLVCVAFLLVGCGEADSGRPARPVKPASAKPASVKPAQKPARPEPTADNVPKLSLSQKGVTLKWVEHGVLKMSATAREFRGNEVTRMGELIGFSAHLYENGKPATTMTAPRVVADTANRVVTATGGVVMKSLVRKTVVKSDWAKWYEKQQKVVGNGGVTIKSDAWTAESAAFVADTGLKTVSLRDSAKGL